MLEVRVDGLTETQATFRRVEDSITRGPMPRVWKELLAELRDYPAPPPGSKYKRTYRLRAGWRAAYGQSNRAGGMFAAENSVPYAPYVVGSEREQASVHRGRWVPAYRTMERYTEKIVSNWEGRIEQAAGS